MADNYVEYHWQEYNARKAKKELEHKKRLRRYLEAYRKKLAEQKKQNASSPDGGGDTAPHDAQEPQQ